jgi:hypothetical protein
MKNLAKKSDLVENIAAAYSSVDRESQNMDKTIDIKLWSALRIFDLNQTLFKQRNTILN